jgi:hypothetical protein
MKLRSVVFAALGAGLLVSAAASTPAAAAEWGRPGWHGGRGHYWHGGWYAYPGYYAYGPYYYPPAYYGPPAVTFAVPGVSVTVP